MGAIWRGWSLRIEALYLPCLHESEDRLREKARDKEWLHVAKPHPSEDHGTDAVRVSSPDPPHSNDPINELVTLAFEAKTGGWFGCSEVGTNKVSGGMGLAFAARLAKVTEGHVWTVTRRSAIHVSSNGTETMGGLYYPGTLIVMRIPETEREIFALRGLVWVDASANRVATVYTSAPNRLRGPIFADLCTLLRPHVCSQRRNSVHKRLTPQPATHVKTRSGGVALTEKRILRTDPHGKAHSGRAMSRKSALCVWASPRDALCMRAVARSAPFREVAVADCAFT